MNFETHHTTVGIILVWRKNICSGAIAMNYFLKLVESMHLKKMIGNYIYRKKYTEHFVVITQFP